MLERARAMATRWRWPPESSAGRLAGVIVRGGNGPELAGGFPGLRGGAPMHFFQRQGDVLQGGQMREKIEGLEDRSHGAAMSQ